MTGSLLALLGTLTMYLLGGVALAAALLLRKPILTALGRGAAVAGAGLHLTTIGMRCAELHRAPFATPTEALQLLAWLIVLGFLLADAIWKLAAIGPFALGVAFVCGTFAGSISHQVTLAPGGLLSEPIISLHLLAILGAFGAFALAFCCAALYLIQRRLLKSKHAILWVKRLPPLQTAERAAFTLTAFGFPMLTLGILAGLARAWSGGMQQGWLTDPRIVMTYAVWIVYALYLNIRLRPENSPARSAQVLLIGLPLCLLAFLVPTAAHRFSAPETANTTRF